MYGCQGGQGQTEHASICAWLPSNPQSTVVLTAATLPIRTVEEHPELPMGVVKEDGQATSLPQGWVRALAARFPSSSLQFARAANHTLVARAARA